MQSFYQNKNVLITGHTGFQGAWLTEILVKWGAKVTGVALEPYTDPNLFSVLKLADKIDHRIVDIRDRDRLTSVLAETKPEIVFHLAAQALVLPSYQDPATTYETNVIGTMNVLEAIRACGSVRSAVIVTTDKVYHNEETDKLYKEDDKLGGHDPYSASKAAADILTQSYSRSFFSPDQYGQSHQTLIGIARSGNVIGGGDWANYRLIPDIIKSVYHSSDSVSIRHPQAVRPWQHVFDPLKGYLLLGQKLFAGETSAARAWNFGPAEASTVSVEEVVKKVIAELGQGDYVVESSGDQLHEAGLLKLDNSKAQASLDWRPGLSLGEAVEWTCGWYKNFYEQKTVILDFSKEQISKFFGN